MSSSSYCVAADTASLQGIYSFLRDYLSAIKAGRLHPFTFAERRARAATKANEPWGPTGPQLAELAALCAEPEACQVIWAVLEYRLKAPPDRWRNVYKSLAAVEYLLTRGPEQCVAQARELLVLLTALQHFAHIGPDGRDVGINVRLRSEAIRALIQDEEGLTQKRAAHSARSANAFSGYSREAAPQWGAKGASAAPTYSGGAGESKGVSMAANAAHLAALRAILQRPENRRCADCAATSAAALPSWASISTGVFICMRCAGIHRGLGVHVSKVRSCTLDTWLPAQVEFMSSTGNALAAAYYEARLDPALRPARESIDLERFIRLKYADRAWADPAATWPPPHLLPTAAPAAASATLSGDEQRQTGQQPQSAHGTGSRNQLDLQGQQGSLLHGGRGSDNGGGVSNGLRSGHNCNGTGGRIGSNATDPASAWREVSRVAALRKLQSTYVHPSVNGQQPLATITVSSGGDRSAQVGTSAPTAVDTEAAVGVASPVEVPDLMRMDSTDDDESEENAAGVGGGGRMGEGNGGVSGSRDGNGDMFSQLAIMPSTAQRQSTAQSHQQHQGVWRQQQQQQQPGYSTHPPPPQHQHQQQNFAPSPHIQLDVNALLLPPPAQQQAPAVPAQQLAAALPWAARTYPRNLNPPPVHPASTSHQSAAPAANASVASASARAWPVGSAPAPGNTHTGQYLHAHGGAPPMQASHAAPATTASSLQVHTVPNVSPAGYSHAQAATADNSHSYSHMAPVSATHAGLHHHSSYAAPTHHSYSASAAAHSVHPYATAAAPPTYGGGGGGLASASSAAYAGLTGGSCATTLSPSPSVISTYEFNPLDTGEVTQLGGLVIPAPAPTGAGSAPAGIGSSGGGGNSAVTGSMQQQRAEGVASPAASFSTLASRHMVGPSIRNGVTGTGDTRNGVTGSGGSTHTLAAAGAVGWSSAPGMAGADFSRPSSAAAAATSLETLIEHSVGGINSSSTAVKWLPPTRQAGLVTAAVPAARR